MEYLVSSSALFLRDLPDERAQPLVSLPHGQLVRRVDERDWNDGWYQVTATIPGKGRYRGYSSARYLVRADATTNVGRKDPRYYQAVKDHLARHGIARSSEDISTENFHDMVTTFQEHAQLHATGDVDADTLWELQEPFVRADQKYKLVNFPVDVAPGYNGYETMLVREDVVEPLIRLKKHLHDLGGLLTTAGGLRPLTEKWNKNRSRTSFHYTGLAFDMSTEAGSWKPERDPCVMEWNKEARRWIVWVRAEGGEARTLNALHHIGRWDSFAPEFRAVNGRFVNFTDMASTEGFQSIGPRSSYGDPLKQQDKRDYMSCEWWHFQYEAALTPTFSQFGIELLKIEGYADRVEAAPSRVWEKRTLVFMDGWR